MAWRASCAVPLPLSDLRANSDINNNIFQLQYSDDRQVYIPSVNLDTGGVYRCEVSTEAPDFDTVSKSVQVNVSGW